MELPDSLAHWLRDLCATVSHRQLIVVSGEQQWCLKTAQGIIRLMDIEDSLWFGHPSSSHTPLSINQFRQYLGRETQGLVYDAHAGLRASALMALSGTVKRHGIMLLLCPTLAHWPYVEDPIESERISFGFRASEHGSEFIRWLVQHIERDNITLITPDTIKLAKPEKPIPLVAPNNLYATIDQQNAAELIVSVLSRDEYAPLVITADRGRGKSSALGIAAAKLMQKRRISLAVTAPRPSAVKQVFEHAARVLVDVLPAKSRLDYQESSLVFAAPDALLTRQTLPDAILIDEAAAIPHDMLVQIAALGVPCIFSTTVHGYEGSGRGFEIRFKQHLNTHFQGYQSCHLSHPIRWYKGDSLERFWFSTLLMLPPQTQSACSKVDCTVKTMEDGFHILAKNELLAAPGIVYQAFRLLIDAHYQTTQDDLVRMFDSMDNELAVLIENHQVLAIALLALEGTDRLLPLAQAISKGQRRVKGHLSAQYLSYHFARPDWANLQYLRIVRIAVLPSKQGKGLGTNMIEKINGYATDKGYDCLTASFGLTLPLLAFWRKVGFSSLKPGSKRDAASGKVSILMARALTQRAQALIPYCKQALGIQLTHVKRNSENIVAGQIVETLEQEAAEYPGLRYADKAIISQCAAGIRPMDNAPALLAWFLQSHLTEAEIERFYPILSGYYIKQKSLKTLVNVFGASGKRELMELLRQQLSLFIREHGVL